jgi:hypothetical protein
LRVIEIFHCVFAMRYMPPCSIAKRRLQADGFSRAIANEAVYNEKTIESFINFIGGA